MAPSLPVAAASAACGAPGGIWSRGFELLMPGMPGGRTKFVVKLAVVFGGGEAGATAFAGGGTVGVDAAAGVPDGLATAIRCERPLPEPISVAGGCEEALEGLDAFSAALVRGVLRDRRSARASAVAALGVIASLVVGAATAARAAVDDPEAAASEVGCATESLAPYLES